MRFKCVDCKIVFEGVKYLRKCKDKKYRCKSCIPKQPFVREYSRKRAKEQAEKKKLETLNASKKIS